MTRSRCIFRLNQVPEHEAQAVRWALDEESIPYYETAAGLLNIGVAGLWVVDERQYGQARSLIASVQAQLPQAEPMPLTAHFKQHYKQILLALLAVVIVVGLTIIPYFNW